MKKYASTLIAALILSAQPGFSQDLTLNLTPAVSPIVIPDSGGSFDFTITASNLGSSSQSFDLWCMITLPNGQTYGPVLGPANFTLSAGGSGSRLRSQSIPAGALAGNYSYNAYAGDYPSIVWTSDSMGFRKQAAPGGTELWVGRYNGPANGYDWAQNIAVDRCGNVYVAGHSDQGLTEWDYTTIKYDLWGHLLWVATYNGPTGQDDWVNSIAVDTEGDVFVTGISGTDMGYSGGDWATIKYDKWGRQLWVARYGSFPGTDCAFSIATDEAGNAYVTGCGMGYTTIKYDLNGNQLWMACYSYQDAGDVAYDLALDGIDNVYVTGASPGHESYFDYATIKYDRDGRQLWAARYDGGNSFSDEARRLALDNRGNVYVTGFSGRMVGYTDFATIKYDSSGNPLWIARYDGPAHLDDQAFSIAVDDLGYVYVTGWSNTGPYNSDYTTIKYDSLGNQVWVASYNGPGNGFDKAWSIALEASGYVYVTGESNTSGIDYDYATIKYDAQGNEVWVARYDGPTTPNRADYGRAIALDGWGSAYVVGASMDNTTDYDIATVKYSTGNLANWEPVTAAVLGAPQPQECRLEPPYPNPFNPTTAISFELRATSYVSLKVYDIAGRLVQTLVDGWREAGEHRVTFDGAQLASGIYLCRFQMGEFTAWQKLALIK